MNLSDCVTLEDRLPGYTEVPTERLYAETKTFHFGSGTPLVEWMENFTQRGYTKTMVWLCYSTITPHPTVQAYLVTEAPCT